MNNHENYIKRCIELAKLGFGYTDPNPMVGCVIVHDNKIIGESFHKKYGMSHAEVNAINSVKDKALLSNSTLYVSLEPCCHFGKTPPCTDLIIKHKIPRVVIATTDPNPKISGKGIQILKSEGVEVINNVLKNESDELNIRFNTFHQKNRPYIILKWAETKDGFIDKSERRNNPKINWISSKLSRQIVHKWRTEEQAILIGANTALNDNPYLTNRDWVGSNPKIILLDPYLKTNSNLNIFKSKTIVVIDKSVENKIVKNDNINYFSIDYSKNSINQIIEVLTSLNIISVIVEGGKFTLEKFIETNFWDEARVVIGDIEFKSGLAAPKIETTLHKTEKIENDIINYFHNINI